MVDLEGVETTLVEKKGVKSNVKFDRQDSIDFTPKKTQIEKFQRHRPVNLTNEKNALRKRKITLHEKLNDEAVKRLAVAELLLTESAGYLEAEDGERTSRIKQKDIIDELDIESASKTFNLELSFGPYYVDFTRNGRYLLTGGQKGALSILDCLSMEQVSETNVRETIRDVCFLQNETMWAAAQKKYVHIYDNNCVELHCLREHMMTYSMAFLPYHYLLATIGEFGELRYLDISTGIVPSAHKTKRGPCDAMCLNPATAVINLGHGNGTVTLWTPNVGKPVVEFLSHRGKVTAIECIGENYLVSAGLDGSWKIWDMRKFEVLNRYQYFGTAPSSISASQTGCVGLGFGPHVHVWKDVHRDGSSKPTSPYITHDINGQIIQNIKFRPFEDFCVIGTSHGIQSIVVPGSCLANYDSYSADPYETKKQRQEREIHGLLEKLPAATITVDPRRIGMLDEAPRTLLLEEEKEGKAQFIEYKKNNENRLKKKTGAAKQLLANQKRYNEIQRKLITKREIEKMLIQRNKQQVDQLEEEIEGGKEDTLENVGNDNNIEETKVKHALDRFKNRDRAVYK